jgi:hypothetical protein
MQKYFNYRSVKQNYQQACPISWDFPFINHFIPNLFYATVVSKFLRVLEGDDRGIGREKGKWNTNKEIKNWTDEKSTGNVE